MWRGIVVLSLGAVTLSAQASFELMLVADNGNGTFAQRKIHRFDPVSGAYLGKFGDFSGNIIQTHLRKDTNQIYVSTSDGAVAVYNYNTGLRQASFSYLNPSLRFAIRPDFLRTALFDVFIDFISSPDVPPIGGPVTGNMGSGSYQNGLWYSQSNLIAFDSTNRRFLAHTMNSSGLSSGFVASPSATSGGNIASQLALIGGSNEYVCATNDGFYTGLLSGLGAPIPRFVSSNFRGAASAHDGYFVALTDGVIQFDRFHRQLGTTGSGILTNVASVQTVLAPEPGTMLAVGAGLAALVRKRRTRQS